MERHDILLEITKADNVDKLIEEGKKLGLDGFFSEEELHLTQKGLRFYQAGDKKGNIPLIEIKDPADLERAISACQKDVPFVAVRCSDWKIIPLENLVAEFSRRKKKLYAMLKDGSEIETVFSILQRGVDGAIIPRSALRSSELINYLTEKIRKIQLDAAEIISIDDAGLGERSCIDTVSLLSVGEGMLVGSRSNFFFLVHSETIEGSFVPSRPFRVNAGAVHSYILIDTKETRYLCEIEAGQSVLVVNPEGSIRRVTVGRNKIESRPLSIIRAKLELDGRIEVGSIVLQKAETIRLVDQCGKAIPITSLNVGDKILVHAFSSIGRHIGKEVNEFIIEK